MSKTKELELDTLVSNGMAHGFRPAPSTRTVVADPERFPAPRMLMQQALDGLGRGTDEYFGAEIRSDLTFEQIDRLDLSKPWVDVFPQIAPYVIAWNADAINEETGDWERLPPPVEAGPDVFRKVPTAVPLFLWLCLKWNVGGELPKGLPSTSGMGDGEGAPI